MGIACDTFAQVLHKNHDDNPMNIITITTGLMEEYGIDEKDVYMDATAGGNIIYSRFLELVIISMLLVLVINQ